MVINMSSKTYFKYLFKSIKENFSRLCAISLIILLGTGFIVGLQSSGPDLKATVNTYFNDTNFYDVSIQSNIGLNNDSIYEIRSNISSIDEIESYYQLDRFTYINDSKSESRIIYKDLVNSRIDKLTLIEGRMPNQEHECVALKTYNENSIEISDVINFDDYYFRVVGLVNDPAYLSHTSETTTIGSGSLDNIIYIDSGLEIIEEFNTPTIIKLTFYKDDISSTFDDEYDDFIEEKKKEIENLEEEIISSQISYLENTIRQEVEKAIEEEMRATLKEQIPNITDSLLETLINAYKNGDDYKNLVNEQTETQLNEIIKETTPQIYILTRNENQSYATFKIDSEKIVALAAVFPIFFYGIALLVSITSVTRLVNKDRSQIGTLKSLGYSKLRIYNKYLFFGLLTSIIGSILAIAVGLFVLPTIIITIYGSLYNIINIVYIFDTFSVLTSTLIMIVLILLTISIISISVLKENSASLLIAKAPKAGKKILIERITFLWKHFKFKTKSMLRNVFTFKKNLIMMLIGIGGCTAILLTAFGISDSLSVINKDQFDKIINYDLIVQSDNIEESKKLFSDDDFKKVTSLYYESKVNKFSSSSVSYNKKDDIDVYLLGGNDDLSEIVGFDENINFNDDSVIISEQISSLLNIKEGDFIYLSITPSIIGSSENYEQYQDIPLKISDITTNYVSNYVYIGKNIYKEKFVDLSINSLLLKSYMDDDSLDEFIDEISENSLISSISTTYSTRNIYSNILDNLTAVVVLLVFLSGALIFVVIYNLVDINIDERIKEIATLRVNGYTRSETLRYIYREIIFMSIIAILIGLLLGYFLHIFVINTISSVGLMLGSSIFYQSYLYTILIVSIFIALTALIFIPKINKIKMNEVLKSID